MKERKKKERKEKKHTHTVRQKTKCELGLVSGAARLGWTNVSQEGVCKREENNHLRFPFVTGDN